MCSFLSSRNGVGYHSAPSVGNFWVEINTQKLPTTKKILDFLDCLAEPNTAYENCALRPRLPIEQQTKTCFYAGKWLLDTAPRA